MTKGRKPTPVRLRLIQGNPQKREIPKDVPNPSAELLRAPRHLTREEKRAFADLAKIVYDLGVSARADAIALEMMAVLTVRMRTAKRNMDNYPCAKPNPAYEDHKRVKKQIDLSQVEIGKPISVGGDGEDEYVPRMLDTSEQPGMKQLTPNGLETHSVWLQIYNRSQKQLLTLLSEFGMTPSARMRVRTMTDPGANGARGDGWDRFGRT